MSTERKSIPGREEVCENCSYRDFYTVYKNNLLLVNTLEKSSKLIKNLQDQLIAVTKKLEEKEEKDVKVNPVETVKTLSE